jgi:hypothetical protein
MKAAGPRRTRFVANPLAFGRIFRHNSAKGESTMDDFRVGSVPPSAPYGDRHPYDAAARRRQRHNHDDDDHGQAQDEDTTDTFEASSNGASSDDQQPAASAAEEIEDYYRPSAPAEDDV